MSFREGDQVVFAKAAAGKLKRDAAAVTPDTLYDLASLTKPFVAMTALRLAASGRLNLSARLDSIIGDARGGASGAATLEQLFSHRSGLAPWGGLYLDVPHEPGGGPARRWVLSEAARRSEGQPGEAMVYSDLGYMLAGAAMARIVGRPLDVLVREQITEPLGIADKVFFAGGAPSDVRAQLSRLAAPTERCDWRGRIVQGEVHDENCYALGGVSGHAGLFGIAEAVATFGRAVLDSLKGRRDFLNAEMLGHALAPQPGGSYVMGWDLKQAEGSSAGRRMGPHTFGHLGFTGTSLWCDPDADVVIVLLTNRVHPSRANEKIRAFRPAFHDGVMGSLRQAPA